MRSVEIAEQILFIGPLVLPFLVFIPIRTGAIYGFTHSGQRYRRVDAPEFQPLTSSPWFWAVFSPIVVGAGLWSLAVAFTSAIQTGLVELPSHDGEVRVPVRWPAAWAYMLGAAFIVGSFASPFVLARRIQARPLVPLYAVLVAVLGYGLLYLSSVFSSIGSTAILVAVTAAVIAGAYIRKRYGTCAFAAFCVLLLVGFIYAARSTGT